MKKAFCLLILLLIFFLFMFGCNDKTFEKKDNVNKIIEDKTNEELDYKEPITIRIASPIGNTALTFARVIENKALSKNISVDFKLLDGPMEIPLLLQKEEVDILLMPVNLAAKMYNKGVNYKLLNVVFWGAFNIVTSNETINDWSDLKGKELYLFGEGSTPDIITRFLLKANGIDPETDIKLIYQQANQNALMLIANKISIAVLPEPASTKALMENNDLKAILNYNTEWKEIVGGENYLAQAGMMINNTFAKNKKDLIHIFIKLYLKELKALFNETGLFGELSEKHNLVGDRELVEKSVNRFGINYKSALESKDSLDIYFNVLSGFDPESIGGNIPDDNFYYLED